MPAALRQEIGALRHELDDARHELAAALQAREAAELVAADVLTKPNEELVELRRTKAQLAELAAERARTAAAEAVAQEAVKQAAAAKRALVNAERERARVQALFEDEREAKELLARSAPSRTEERQQQQAAAAELQRLLMELREAAGKDTVTIAGLESQLRSEQIRRGLAEAALETAQLKLAKEEAPRDTTLRNQELREQAQWREIDAARAEIAMLRTRVQELESLPLGKRGAAPQTHKLQQVRTSDEPNAPFSARSLEYMCRLVDETNGSFEGAATANALVLGMHHGAAVPDSMLYTAGTLRNAFHRMGHATQQADAERNRADPGPWCIAQDAGGGTLMVATGHWDAAEQQPVARPLAASDLFRDQGARNGTNTLERAAERGGLNFGRCVASCSDGTDHAVQESQGFCERSHERAKATPGSEGQRAAARARPLAQADFCCIHGKALEENGGMQAAFPDSHLPDALRLLWELVRGPEGRPAQYRKIWADQVTRADGTKLPPLPVALFDQNLKALTEPTEAKWQVNPARPCCTLSLLYPAPVVPSPASTHPLQSHVTRG